jgi:hypothetical protein
VYVSVTVDSGVCDTPPVGVLVGVLVGVPHTWAIPRTRSPGVSPPALHSYWLNAVAPARCTPTVPLFPGSAISPYTKSNTPVPSYSRASKLAVPTLLK